MWSSKRKPAGNSVPVYLNVYDLTPINGYAYWVGLGIYHSGVQVHEVEYAYGAHEQATTGIFEGEPRQCPGFRFRKSILIGRTELGAKEVRSLMEKLAEDYTGNAYHLISKNCNHFCNDACLRLTRKPIPRWVNRLATLGALCKCVLPAGVTAAGVRPAVVEAAAATAAAEAEAEAAERKKLRSHSSRFVSDSATEPRDGRRKRSSSPMARLSHLAAAARTRSQRV